MTSPVWWMLSTQLRDSKRTDDLDGLLTRQLSRDVSSPQRWTDVEWNASDSTQHREDGACEARDVSNAELSQALEARRVRVMYTHSAASCAAPLGGSQVVQCLGWRARCSLRAQSEEVHVTPECVTGPQ